MLQGSAARLDGALGLLRRGLVGEAWDSCQSLLREEPQNTEALSLLCFLSMQRRDLSAALGYIDRVIAVDAQIALAHFNRAVVLDALKKPAEALASYERAIEIQPTLAEAHSNKAVTELELGRAGDALLSATRATELRADLAPAWFNRGNAHRSLSRWVEALADYNRAIELQPRYPEAYCNRGIAESALRRRCVALASFRRSLALRPDSLNALVNYGNAQRESRQWKEAVQSYERAISLDARCAEAHAGRGAALRRLGRLPEALESVRKAYQLEPQLRAGFGQVLYQKLRMCDWQGLDADLGQLAERIRRGEPAATPFEVIGCLDSPSLQRTAAENHVRAEYPQSPAAGPAPPYHDAGPVVIGYFSADYESHATAHLIAELLEVHDRSHFRVIGFSFGPESNDPMRRRLAQACDEFVDVHDRSDHEVAKLARRLRVDIAVDLKGFTEDSRPGIFALRAAPVQVNYLGYPGTMGAPYIDYLIADRTVVPEQEVPGYSEKIVSLPNSYQPNDRKRTISARQYSRSELGLPEHAFVFCCFNNNWKILPQTFECWMAILKQVPLGVLWLLEDNRWARDNLESHARRLGVDPRRLVFAKRADLPEHLARHRAADLFLDTWPCNAHTTASDALWVGLPLLTWPGRSFAARVSASLVSSVGLTDFIATSPQDYVRRAVALAANPSPLAEARRHLDANRPSLPLFATDAYARHLETAYLAMHERCLAGLPAEHMGL